MPRRPILWPSRDPVFLMRFSFPFLSFPRVPSLPPLPPQTHGEPQTADPLITSAISGFPFALNAALPSPDGRWLAVGCDAPLLYLLPADPE